MSVDVAFQRLRDANPVPRPAALREARPDPSVFLLSTQQRSREMQTEVEPVKTVKPQKPLTRRWVPALAAFVVVIVAIAGVVMLTDSTPDVGFTPTPEEIARSFVEARDTKEIDRAMALFAPGAVVDTGLIFSVEEHRDLFAFFEATGRTNTVDDCTATVTGPIAEVMCTYTVENAHSRALGVGPYGGSTAEFVIVGGQIEEMTDRFESGLFSVEASEAFRSWVQTNHPEDDPMMYIPRFGTPNLTPESISLWEKNTVEFVASLSG